MKSHGAKSSGYSQWLQRVRRVVSAYQNDFIKEDKLQAYQLFILDFGQFNANFTLEELERLDYPKSPFAMMHKHSYLRTTETWAMEMMRKAYINERKVKESVYPVFIDAPTFWTELERYCHVVEDFSILDDIDLSTLRNEEESPQVNHEADRVVNPRRWYRDDDITDYINLIIDKELGGYRSDSHKIGGHDYPFRYLLNTAPDGFIFSCITPAIDTIGRASPIDFYLNKKSQEPPDEGRIDYRLDIFDELMPQLSDISEGRVQIIFPYNIRQNHWLTGEIIISKASECYQVQFFAHDPCGGGKVDVKNINLLKKSISERIRNYDPHADITFEDAEISPYTRRQHEGDGDSCGVITTRDIVLLLKGQSLNPDSVFECYALDLRNEQLNKFREFSPDNNFIKRNTVLNFRTSRGTVEKNKSSQIWIRLNDSSRKQVAMQTILRIIANKVIEQQVPEIIRPIFKESNIVKEKIEIKKISNKRKKRKNRQKKKYTIINKRRL